MRKKHKTISLLLFYFMKAQQTTDVIIIDINIQYIRIDDDCDIII